MDKDFSNIIQDVMLLLNQFKLKNNCFVELGNLSVTFPNSDVSGILYYIFKNKDISTKNFFENLEIVSNRQNNRVKIILDPERIRMISIEESLPYKELFFYITLHEFIHYNELYSKNSHQYINYKEYSKEIEKRTDTYALHLFKNSRYYNEDIEKFIFLQHEDIQLVA